MGADSKNLSWVLLRLTRDIRTRRQLGQTAKQSLGSLFGLRSVRDLEQTDLVEGWRSWVLQKLQVRQGKRLDLSKDTAREAYFGQRRRAGSREAVHARRRRWAGWKPAPASSWDFPTLNSSFPFTIPSVPTNVFLFAQHGGHGNIPSGVMMPPGLGTAARKFHSMSLTRQPGVPYDGEDDGSVPTDAAALSAQIMQGDAASRTSLAFSGRKPTPGRRSDGPSGSVRTRAKSYMFAHAATGIPKHENRIALQKPQGSAEGTEAEELATSVGEDAFFHRGDAMGIADGVGGWAGVKDADPSLFARRLMHNVSRETQRYEDIDDELFSYYFEAAPLDVLRRAYEITLDEMEAHAKRGSSTACVVILRGDELRVANLGDCGLTVVRQGDMVYRTEEQQHSFNYPYQLGTEQHSDMPSDAQVFRLKIQKGDIIIVGSDGVFDNLFDEDILEEVCHHLPSAMRADREPELKYSNDSLWYESQSSDKLAALSRASDVVAPAPASSSNVVAASPSPLSHEDADPSPVFSLPQFHIDPVAISRAIAYRAKQVSQDSAYAESPFQMRAMQEGLYYQGGKRDDITVIVAVVTDLEDTPDRR
ncbi:protein serine/threonine phosphatase 2C [Coemansia reversa NRRL 1564]|uniref:Protein phosphatase n=1 Tax=Coemansia reversa (strain ATCC 12441 / NRRL 1564) TaxID=763665 RepID=A0A2G5BIX0_COERN|nr:protein serine/threonine phosphatase 2C [Coemansia reversa NRRL 1564]|eukprot:PIA18922.1 protein serine/threonine phosphatase 2C [Coemansia reversa NRRL 1564]